MKDAKTVIYELAVREAKAAQNPDPKDEYTSREHKVRESVLNEVAALLQGPTHYPDGCPTHDPEGIPIEPRMEVGESRLTETAEGQIERLAAFILEQIPGEPSQSEGAVDTAIRVMTNLLTNADVARGFTDRAGNSIGLKG